MKKRAHRQYDDDKGFKFWKNEVIKPLKKRSQMRCELCGKKDNHLSAHHLLPYSRFPEYRTNLTNLIFICSDCHAEIHANPFIHHKIIERECKRRKLDWRDFYESEITDKNMQ